MHLLGKTSEFAVVHLDGIERSVPLIVVLGKGSVSSFGEVEGLDAGIIVDTEEEEVVGRTSRLRRWLANVCGW